MPDACILLITHNREEFAKRWFNFYTNNNCSVPIVVAASGTSKSTEAIKNIVSKTRLRITLLIYDENKKFLDKVINTLNKIDFTYVAISADDDYIIPATLIKAASFLKNQSDIVSVTGEGYTIATLSDNVVVKHYPQNPIYCETPIQRLHKHLLNYTPTFYSVYRKVDLLELYVLAKQAIHDGLTLYDTELYMTGVSMLKGKSYKLNDLYMVRQANNPRSASYNQKNAIEHFVASGNYITVSKLLTKEFAKKNKTLSSFNFEQTIINIIATYCIKHAPINKLNIILSNLKYQIYPVDLVKACIKRMLIKFSAGMHAVLAKICNVNQEEITRAGAVNKYKDFKEIELLISEYPLGVTDDLNEIN